MLKEAANEPHSGTPERQTPISGKQVIVIVDEADKEEMTFKKSTIVPTLMAIFFSKEQNSSNIRAGHEKRIDTPFLQATRRHR
jgi:hypothetical protein